MTLRQRLQLYFIMGSDDCLHAPEQVVEEALAGGITLFQFREKGARAHSDTATRALALELQQRCRRHDVPFVVNDDVELALAIGADGVHVGQQDESVAAIRARCPRNFIIGASAISREEAERASREGADYLGIGPVLATGSKADAERPIGLQGLADILPFTGGLPTVAIGGIDASCCARVMRTGVDGVAVISAISRAAAPRQAAAGLKSLTARQPAD
ncbi:thiamine-phosphate diphosphorylase [Kushneria sinocarnis]|uniref:Thiamine-phosphate synthase n=1 Tax=Kushneria sinocarnis TaxID=595502 RepID=A0A420WZR8_9GAMM|nr:thiamine phosphate synthase [Kushneria sinocarnis]RKR06843.1 thiamine-phosphate diphosphorylase [Kushneria sinocarnis]